MRPQLGDPRFSVLFEACPDPVFIASEDGIVLEVNSAACLLHRCRRQDLIGRSVLELVPVEDRAAVRDRFPGWGEGKLTSVRERSLTLDGRVVPVSVHGARIEFRGRRAVLLIVRDVTEYEAAVAEAEAARVFAEDFIRCARLMEVAVDGQGRVRIFNETGTALTGRREETVLGKDWVEMFVPEVRAAEVRRALAQVWDGGGRVEMECPVLTVKGTEKFMALRFGEITHPALGRLVLISGVDLTAFKREESYRMEVERQMMGAQKLEGLGRLAGGVAHDFNNLLTAILGNAALVRGALPAGGEAQELLLQIEKTALQAADLCRQLLACAGPAKPRHRVMDLAAAVEEVRGLLEVSAGRQIPVEIVRDPCPATVSADLAHVRQILLNLVINAADAIRERPGAEGRIRVEIRKKELDRKDLERHPWSASLPPGRYVALSVADDGCGIPARLFGRLVEPFYSTKQAGRGLGLAAVLGIVRAHDGVLQVESEEGVGSKFTVCFPEMSADEEQAAVEVPPVDEVPLSGKALFVDDEESVRVLGAKLLESFGCKVVTARDGAEAVDVFREARGEIRLIVMDLSMPRMGGKEAWEAIRKMDPDVPVLLISGFSSASLGQLDRHTGFLPKPFRVADLREGIRALMAGAV